MQRTDPTTLAIMDMMGFLGCRGILRSYHDDHSSDLGWCNCVELCNVENSHEMMFLMRPFGNVAP